jgi:nucleolar protein 56
MISVARERGHVSDVPPSAVGWFEGADRDGPAASRHAVENGTVDEPRDWPAIAVETGLADDEDDDYEDDDYDTLHEATLHATRAAVRERERDDDRQLIHRVRAMDDAPRVA